MELADSIAGSFFNVRVVAPVAAILFGLLFYWSITSKNRNYHD